eukprot:GILI01028535.1.p1 GENE.GILI01028535.1~~GILI01028535.1.p1  ORF type:complete len:145 (+),score=25.50 GILI01028535.1:84-518(+)
MGHYGERTNRHFFVSRANAFFSRLPIARIQRALALESIKNGRIRPWKYSKEQVLGAPVSLSFDYNPRPVRLIGTIMDTHSMETSIKGGLKVYSRNEETNMMMWIPSGNPKLRYDITGSAGSFDHYMNERDKWDEAWATGKARVK